MKCRKVKRSLLAYIDRELNADEFNEVKKHIEQCSSCREEYERLNSLNQSIGAMYKKAEMAEAERIRLIDNVYEAISKNHLPFESETPPKEFSAFAYKRKRGLFSIYGRQIKGGIAAIFIMCIITFAFANKWSLLHIGTQKVAKNDMYKVEKHYDSLEKADGKIKDIPFVVPAYVPKGYMLKDIEYSEDYSSRRGVKFTYEDKNYNQLEISYSQRYRQQYQQGTEDDTMHIGNGAIRVETSQFMACPRPVEKAKGNAEMTQKSLVVGLKNFGVMAVINYNSKVSDEDKSGDAELVKIINGYLSNTTFDFTPVEKGKSEYETLVFKTFQELNNNVPQGLKIGEPAYMTEGFKLKEITYKKVTDDFFIINAVYEDGTKANININYRLKSKGWVTEGNSGKIETIDIYNLVSNVTPEKNTKLVKAGKQKTMPYLHPDYDINIFMQYNEEHPLLSKNADSELRKVAESISKK